MKDDVEPGDSAMRDPSVPEPVPVARRALLQGLASTAAAVVLPGPATASQAAPERHAGHQAPGAAAEAPRTEAPRLLDDHELATLERLAERLVPGSAQTGVPRLADRLLAVDTAEEQRRFRNALGAFEREARTRHARPWVELAESEQTAILSEAASATPARWEPPAWTKGQPVVTVPPPGPPPPANLRDHLDYLRGVVAHIHFNTEAGMKELGWTGNMFWDGLPECGTEVPK